VTGSKAVLSTITLMVTGLCVGLLVASCGIRPTGVISGNEAPKGVMASMILYFTQGTQLRATVRPLSTSNQDPVSLALGTLIQGPTAEEKSGGLGTDLPVLPIKVTRREDQIQVFLEGAKHDGGLTRLGVDQIACTAIVAANNAGYVRENLKVLVVDFSTAWQPESCPLRTP
jgi:hypothetical protein